MAELDPQRLKELGNTLFGDGLKEAKIEDGGSGGVPEGKYHIRFERAEHDSHPEYGDRLKLGVRVIGGKSHVGKWEWPTIRFQRHPDSKDDEATFQKKKNRNMAALCQLDASIPDPKADYAGFIEALRGKEAVGRFTQFNDKSYLVWASLKAPTSVDASGDTALAKAQREWSEVGEAPKASNLSAFSK